MCGRYFIDADGPAYRRVSDALAETLKRGEIFPSDTVPVLTAEGFALMRWGFPRFDGKGILINARAETIAVKPMFAVPFANFRCLLPASSYFEWRKEEGKKQKYRLFVPCSPALYFAGIAKDYGDDVPHFVILTRPAAESVAHVHDRMPVILPEHAHEAWLRGGVKEAAFAMDAAVTELQAEPA